MSDQSTKEMAEEFIEQAPQPMFLTGMFNAPAKNFFTSEKVEVDIERDNEEVALVVHDLTAGNRKNEATKFENKEFTPPAFDEEGEVSAYRLMYRSAGMTPYEQVEYADKAVDEIFKVLQKIQNKILRAIEMMASQIATTGVVTLTDANGVALYGLDYNMRAAHKIPVTWADNGSAGDPLADFAAGAKLLRSNGKVQPKRLLCGGTALAKMFANAKVQLALRKDGLGLGQLAPQARGEGGVFQGYLWHGYYLYEIWSYDGMYKDPVSGAMKYYIPENVVIMTPEAPKWDAKYGHIPIIKKKNLGIDGLDLPSRIMSTKKNIDLTVHSYVSENGKHAYVSAGTRPMLMPTGIDQHVVFTVT